jgi:hypothetical protein
MAPEEAVALTKLSRLTLALTCGSVVMFVSALAVLLVWEGSQTSDSVLTIALVFLSAMVGSVAGLIFLSQGGAASHFSYLGVLLPLLYVYTLLVLYMSVKLALFMSTKFDTKKFLGSKSEFIFAACSFWIAGLAEIIVTLRLPRLHSFLKDFQLLPRSKHVVLKEWVFPHKIVTEEDDEINEL